MDFYVLHWIVITIVFIIINAFEIEISKKSLLFSFIVANAILVPALILIFNKKHIIGEPWDITNEIT